MKSYVLNSSGILLVLSLCTNQIHAESPSELDKIKRILSVQQAEIDTIRKSIVPVGTVVAWTAATAPAGWLICDGSDLSAADYPTLFQTIGVIYNNQKNPTSAANWGDPGPGKFRIPDYRGLFLRSTGRNNLGSDIAVGGWQDDATSTNGIALSGSAPVLNSNTVAAAGHQHQLVSSGPDRLTVQSVTEGGKNRAVQTDIKPNENLTATTGGGSTADVGISGGNYSLSSGDEETRPQNKGVVYIIRAR